MRIISRTANKIAFGFKRAHPCLIHPCDEFLDFRHHFRADTVTGEKKQFLRRHAAPFEEERRPDQAA
jgi:hypothetical protein